MGQDLAKEQGNGSKTITLHKTCDDCFRLCHFIGLYDDFAEHEEDYFCPEDALNDPWDDEDTFRENFDHRGTATVLEYSGKLGCHLCSLLYDQLSRDSLREELRERERTFSVDEIQTKSYEIKIVLMKSVRDGTRVGKDVTRSYFGSLVMIEFLPLESGEARSCSLDLYLYSSPIAENPTATTASDASYALARRWVQNCASRHRKCTRDIGLLHQKPPTRLIDVGSDSQEPKLYETFQRPPGASIEYVTLSYCWGRARTLTLTTTNYQSFLRGIPMNELPTTLRDAIIITQNLGYRYIWIDSLCIVQDSPSDWKQESVTMSRVYSESVFTIAALWAPNSDAGCFAKINPLITQPCKVCEVSGGVVYAVPSERTVRPDAECKVDGLREGTPLLERAWVMQERLLSRRILYYGPKGLYWECQELEANEALPNGSPNTAPSTSAVLTEESFNTRIVHPQDSAKDMWLLPNLKTSAKDPQTKRHHFYLVWDSIIAKYWASQLTYSSDILIALTGITDVFQARTGLTFTQGVWHEFLPLDLMWHVRTHNQHIPTTRLEGFPTWSWASIRAANHKETSTRSPLSTAQAHYSLTELGTMWSVLAQNCEVVHRRQMGNGRFEEDAVCIKLRAPLFHTTLGRMEVKNPYYRGDDTGEKDSDDDGRRLNTISHQKTIYEYSLPSSCPIRFRKNWVEVIPDTTPASAITEITCVVLARDMDTEVGTKETRWIGSAGLMLKKVPSPGLGMGLVKNWVAPEKGETVYERVGYWGYSFSISSSKEKDFKIGEKDYGDMVVV
ncbi:MAG: hypothetical protein Q9216_005712 [Gyalolechia sp. 2 TL-2023]